MEISVTGKKILPQEGHSCHMKELPVTERKCYVSCRKYNLQEGNSCDRKEIPVYSTLYPQIKDYNEANISIFNENRL